MDQQHRVSRRPARSDQHRRLRDGSATRAYLKAIETVTAQPVRTLVNTHHHGDHTFGNYLFSSATIVGHEATWTSIFDSGEPRSAPFWTEIDWGDIVLEPPFLTYTDSVTLWVDDLRADVRHVGTPAHTTNDSIVWLAERKVLYCGDLLFNGGTPFLAQGSVAGAIHVLEEVLTRSARKPSSPGMDRYPDPDSSTTSWATCASFNKCSCGPRRRPFTAGDRARAGPRTVCRPRRP